MWKKGMKSTALDGVVGGISLKGTLRQEKAMERLGEGAFQADRRLKVLTTELDSLVQRTERTL